ncbi:unnamed protein product [Rotaria sp. Silwood1]|nr:unnamed protein product [Rotaria sp. Silwood1]
MYQVSDKTRIQPLDKRKTRERPKKVSTALNLSRSGFDSKSSKVTVHSFIIDQIQPESTDYEEINLRIRNELLELHY